MSTETQFCGTVTEVTDSPFSAGTAWSSPSSLVGDTTGTAASYGSGFGGWACRGLKCTNFGFSSVTGTINSITVDVESAESGGNATYKAFRIVKGGNYGADTTYDGDSVPSSKSFFNAPGGLWSDSWSASDITASDFGVAFDGDGFFPAPGTCYHYRVKITVDYTASGGFVPFPEPRGLAGGLDSMTGGMQ